MTNKLERIQRVVNSSGFPLQIGIADFVKRTEPNHYCKVLYTEHSWHDPVADQGGFIDLVIEGVESKCIFVVECKRVLDTSWIFLNTKPVTSTRRHAKLWVTEKGNHSGPLSLFGWADATLEPRTPESTFCVVDGQDERSRPMLERVASELISATENFAREDSIRVNAKSRGIHFYASVLVTTAKLALAQFTASEVSLKDGKVDVANAQEVPFLRFRKQLSFARSDAELDAYRTDLDRIDYAKERTVFIVHAEALSDFLTAFEPDIKWKEPQ
jgi:hypothetical protein